MTLRHDLTIRQGETWSFAWTKRDAAGTEVSLSGYTARASFKRNADADADAYLTNDASAQGGSISITGGTVALAMTAAQTAALGGLRSVEDVLWGAAAVEPADRIELAYDLLLTSPGGTVTRELEGSVFVIRGMTP